MTKDLIQLVSVAVGMTMLMGLTTEGSEQPDVALWLARSCVGEAGFYSGNSGECSAIAHVYRKRSEQSGMTYYRVMRVYSAGIRNHRGHKRPWVFELNRKLTRPEHWPNGPAWSKYRGYWNDALLLADAFIRNEIPDPLPAASHYGGAFDHWRAVRAGWTMLKTPYKNRFYSVKRRKTK